MNKELILKDLGIAEEELGSLVRESGVLVNVKVAGGHTAVTLNKNIFNQDDMSKEMEDFLNQHFSGAKLHLLDSKTRKTFTSIANGIRNELYRRSLSVNGNFLTKEDFKEFYEFFEDKKIEFETMVNVVCSNYSEIYDNFVNYVYDYIYEFELSDETKEAMALEVIKKIPQNEKEMRDSFYCSLRANLFEAVSEDDDELIQEILEKSVKENALELIQSGIVKIGNLIFKHAERFINIRPNHDKTVEAAKEDIVKCKSLNYMDSDAVNNWIGLLEDTAEADEFVRASLAEELIANIYRYFKENNLLDSLDMSKFEEKFLEDLLSVY